MGRRSQSRDSFAAVRYAVDTGSMPPPPRRNLWARKRVILPVAAATLIGAGFVVAGARRQPVQKPAAATLDCASARDVWRPACRPDNIQTWVAKAASARDDAPASTGALDDTAKRASTPKRVVEARARSEAEAAPAPQPLPPAAASAKPAKAPSRVAAAPEAPPEPARKPEAVKPAPEPIRAAEAKPAEPQASAKPAPQPAVPAAKLSEPPPVQQAAKPAEPQAPAKPAPQPVEPAVKHPEPQPVQEAVKPAEPQPVGPAPQPVEGVAKFPAPQPVQQAAKPEPPPVVVEPPRRPAPPVKVVEEPAAPVADRVEGRARQKRLAQRAARREARAATLVERRGEPRVIVVRRPAEEPAPPRRLARVRPAEQGVRTTAYFPPGFVQALRHYNARYAYDD